MHRHANVEIVTIMVSGVESHEDTLGIHENYEAGDVQLISAGSGMSHAGGKRFRYNGCRASADMDPA